MVYESPSQTKNANAQCSHKDQSDPSHIQRDLSSPSAHLSIKIQVVKRLPLDKALDIAADLLLEHAKIAQKRVSLVLQFRSQVVVVAFIVS